MITSPTKMETTNQNRYILLPIVTFNCYPLTRIFTGNNIVTGYYMVTVIVTMIVTIGVSWMMEYNFAVLVPRPQMLLANPFKKTHNKAVLRENR